MDPYIVLKTLHILSATVLFGTGLGTAFHMWFAHRSVDAVVVARVARQVVWADFAFTTPAIVLQPLTGFAMISLGGHSLAAPWLLTSYALYLLAGACWLPVVVIQVRIRDLAVAAARDNTPLPPAYFRMMRVWFVLGWPAFLALLVVFWLMVAKPSFD